MSIKILLKKHKESIRTKQKTISFTKEELDSIINDITKLYSELNKIKSNADSKNNDEIVVVDFDAGKW